MARGLPFRIEDRMYGYDETKQRLVSWPVEPTPTTDHNDDPTGNPSSHTNGS